MNRIFNRLFVLFATAGLAALISACSVVGGGNVGTTGDTAADASAAQRFVPTTLPGYAATDARNLTDALAGFAGGAALLSANPVLVGAVAQIDGMIACYSNTGAVAARIYVQNNIAALIGGDIPSAGALAVINQDRVVNNFLPCALGGGAQGLSAQQGGIQPCSSSGQFVVDGETLLYVYAATDPQLCATFQALMPA